MNDSLEAKQRELEDAAREGGIKRYREKVQQDQSATPPGRRLLPDAVQRMEQALKDELAKLLGGRANQRAWMAHILTHFETDAVALVTATKCIQALALPRPKANLLQNVAGRIVNELQGALCRRNCGQPIQKSFAVCRERRLRPAIVGGGTLFSAGTLEQRLS